MLFLVYMVHFFIKCIGTLRLVNFSEIRYETLSTNADFTKRNNIIIIIIMCIIVLKY